MRLATPIQKPSELCLRSSPDCLLLIIEINLISRLPDDQGWNAVQVDSPISYRHGFLFGDAKNCPLAKWPLTFL
jgi:hypothetical protein